MSIFGKSDFCDWCEMHNTPEDIVRVADIFVGTTKVEIKEVKDLYPYYSNLMSSMASSKDRMTIFLSDHSYADDLENDELIYMVATVVDCAKKAKEDGRDLTIEYMNGFDYGDLSDSAWKAIIDVVNNNPKIIDIASSVGDDYRLEREIILNFIIPRYVSGIHTKRGTEHRKKFLDFLTEKGYGKDDFHPMISRLKSSIRFYEIQEKKDKEGEKKDELGRTV